jgi:hypothetical protein
VSVTTRHDLFAVDPAEFVAARDELARQLKSDGQREEAAAVKALRRPQVPIWALNRVARDAGDAMDALMAAAADAGDAQDALLAGDGDRDELREALARRRRLLHDVVHRATDVIEQSGRSAGAQQRDVESALNAVIASDALTELLRKGELIDVVDEDADDDLASLLGASVTRGATEKPRPVTKLSDVRAAKEAAAARKELERLRKAATAAADAMDKARRSAVEADNDVAEAREALARTEARAGVARAAHEAAERAHAEAVTALHSAEES